MNAQTHRACLGIVATACMLVGNAALAQLLNRTEPLPEITSAGQPDEAAFRAIAEEGYAAVIDLRGPAEDRGLDEPALVESLGMEYIALPIADGSALNMENARTLDSILSGIEGPVLIHCASGNRVGGLLALREGVNGATTDDALAVGTSGGMSPMLMNTVREQLEAR